MFAGLSLLDGIPININQYHFSLSPKDWLAHSKGLNESFKPSYNEHACPVREYCPTSQSE